MLTLYVEQTRMEGTMPYRTNNFCPLLPGSRHTIELDVICWKMSRG